MITQWKRSLTQKAADLFDKDQKSCRQTLAQLDELYRQIGKLQMEIRFTARFLIRFARPACEASFSISWLSTYL
jgi:hypothetical protein